MNFKSGFILVMLLVTAFICISGCTGTTTAGEENTQPDSLLVYCGAGMREPMDDIAIAFEEKTGVAIHYNYGGSNTLLSQMELTKQGDAYMPGATSYIDTAREKGFIDTEANVVYHVPIIIVPKGNPAGITSLEDLAKPGIKVELGDAEAAAIGTLSDSLLKKNGILDEVLANTIARTATVNELIVHTALRQTDAAIIFEDLFESEKLDRIDIPKEQNIVKVVPIGSLTFSEYPETAREFVNFVASDEAKAIFTAHGFVTYPDPYYGEI
ncbi:molybdate ABC transporter substrate-binding protein [Methanocalculus sp.]|uniref:molybdate ABC transporter substrate-binding protein n=1 Tax=Methanocalculus sp. TaxID=2004547 RepID=UPI002718CCE0|nr:molybdate ABC transporter substrate-binding protein [Methanocalculus sp.]MDO8841954.1 molybdate ABC transporter substrate-binding protein [Methanocalculus sp.]